MNISEIKQQLNVSAINLRSFNDPTTNEPTGWVSDFKSETRQNIVMHQKVLDQIKADPTMTTLHFKQETKTGSKGEYQNYVIAVHDNSDVVATL